MKSRILKDGYFGGSYTDDFLEYYKDGIINGEIVSDWNLSNEIPSESFLKPKMINSKWSEGAEPEEIENFKQAKIKEIKYFYTSIISKLLALHIERNIIDGIAIPVDILAERERLKAECNLKISNLNPIINL